MFFHLVTDQGSQFTSAAFTGTPTAAGVKMSTDGAFTREYVLLQ